MTGRAWEIVAVIAGALFWLIFAVRPFVRGL